MLWQPPRETREFLARNRLLGAPARFRDASIAEAYYCGLQYEHLPAWSDTAVPVAQRAPRVVLPLYSHVVDEIIRFSWGGHREPALVAQATRTEEEAPGDDVGPALTADQAGELSSLVCDVARHAKLKQAVEDASCRAGVVRSSLIVIGMRGGHLRCHIEPGHHCTPVFDAEAAPGTLKSVEIRYQFPKEEQQPSGGLKTVWYWYRRIVDEQQDTTFRDAPVETWGRVEPRWEIDAERSVTHGLGFTPAVWLRCMPDSRDEVDGRPIIDPTLHTVIDDLCRTWSQKGRAVSYGCDPKPVRIGVDEDERQKLDAAPGKPWDVPVGGDIKLLEIQGSGAERAGDHLRELTAAFREAASFVVASPEVLRGDISGRVLELLHRPMLALGARLRQDAGEAYARVANLALRIVMVTQSSGSSIWLPRVGKISRMIAETQLAGPWIDYPMQLIWPEWFPVQAAERKADAETAALAVRENLISRRTATRNVAALFGVADPHAEHEEIELELAKAAEEYGPLLNPPPKGQGGNIPDGEDQARAVDEEDGEE